MHWAEHGAHDGAWQSTSQGTERATTQDLAAGHSLAINDDIKRELLI